MEDDVFDDANNAGLKQLLLYLFKECIHQKMKMPFNLNKSHNNR